MLNKPDFSIKRRWDDDVVFKNQARGTDEKGKRKEFINVSFLREFGIGQMEVLISFRIYYALTSTRGSWASTFVEVEMLNSVSAGWNWRYTLSVCFYGGSTNEFGVDRRL